MNFLLLTILMIFGTSCSEPEIAETELSAVKARHSSKEESNAAYLESDFYQETLEYEARQLGRELVSIQEEMENGNSEPRGRFEEVQNLLASNEQNRDWNQSIVADILEFRPGGPRPPRCEEDDDFREFKPCPIPKLALENLLLSSKQWLKSGGKIEVFNKKGQLVGRMEGMTEVANSNGTLLKAEIDFDADSAVEVRFTNRDVLGEIRTSAYKIIS